MFDHVSSTRREFIRTSGSTAGGAWLLRFAPLIAAAQACATEAAQEGRAFGWFTPREGADFEAFSARIIPTDDTPGAREAQVVYFADEALGGFMGDIAPIVRGGLERLHTRVQDSIDGAASFADLTEAQQDEVIGAVEQEDPGFFFFGRVLTSVGMVSNPEYGGNQGRVGWELIGFEPSFTYQPPFGFYDRGEHGVADEGGDQ